jgi:hypothetical protein
MSADLLQSLVALTRQDVLEVLKGNAALHQDVTVNGSSPADMFHFYELTCKTLLLRD